MPRKAIARFLGEEQTVMDNVQDAVIEGGMAGLGEIGGSAVVRGSDAINAARAGKLGRAAGRDTLRMRPADIAQAEADFARHGIDPYPPQTTGSMELKQRWETLEGLPQTADVLHKAKRKQGPQVQQAIQDYIDTLGPEWTPDKMGKETVTAAKKSVEKLEKARALKVKPLYDKAYRTAPPVDIRDIEEMVDTQLSRVRPGGTAEKALKKVQKMLYEAPGEEGGEQVLTNNLGALDELKKELDFMLEGPDAASVQSGTLRQLAIIKDRLVKLMDEASPDYRTARKKFEELSPSVDVRKEGIVGDVSRLKSRDVHTAAKKLLNTANTPAQVAKARFDIRRQNPEAWDAVVRTYLVDRFSKIKLTTRDFPNVAGRFRDLVVGDEQQRKIMHAAMGDKQFKAFMEFGDLLEKVSKLYGKESQTVGKGEHMKQMAREGSSKIATAVDVDLTAPLRPIANWWQDISRGRYREELAAAFVDPHAMAKLKKLRSMNPRNREFIKRLGAFVGADFGGKIAADNPPDFAPAGISEK